MSAHDPRVILERLIRERREDYAGLSRLLGRNAAYVHQFIHRGSPRRLREEDRKTLANHFDIDERLLGGGGPPMPSTGADERLIPIPRFDITASAGSGALDGSEQPTAHIGFSRSLLGELSQARAEDLSVIRVRGDSMHPSLADGDNIMVDRSDGGERLREGIYVLRLDDALLVKRLSINPATKRVTMSSDNPAYPTWTDLELDSVFVIGRVVWSARRIS